ncbi:unnamed protein product [Linum tenue]|uniref:Uncharacterized protein n=1 Tax=Linum tenue TaxID=586396 RepID=A0AAV0NDL6_9ROSI|nr:unnamed protein product [Linum tenue]
MVMHGPLDTWTLAPRPSMVLKEFITSSCFSVITMSRWNVIHSGSSWITAWRRVPGFGLTASLSLESVTT